MLKVASMFFVLLVFTNKTLPSLVQSASSLIPGVDSTIPVARAISIVTNLHLYSRTKEPIFIENYVTIFRLLKDNLQKNLFTLMQD